MEQASIIISIGISILTLITLLVAFRDRIWKNGGEERNISDRVASLEKSDANFKRTVENINCDITKIKENHLAHIQEDIYKININLAEINTTLQIKLKN